MKRAAAVLLTLALMLSLTACMSRGSMQLKRADRYFDDLRGAFKMSDVTNSARAHRQAREQRQGLVHRQLHRAVRERDWARYRVRRRVGARQADKSESLYQNRVRQRGHPPENERKSARIYARHRRQIRTRVQFPKRRQLYNDRLRPFHRNSSDDSRICINKNGRNFLQLLPLLYNAIFELL